MKMKILIDLDILTVALWNRNKEAIKFLERVKNGEFDVYTPFALFETVGKWKYERLKTEISGFYELYSKRIISSSEAAEKIERLNLEGRKISEEFTKEGIKEEDSTLVLIASIFDIDILVTFNRKHLRNKRVVINEVLRKHGLKGIKILLPNEL